MSPLTAVATHHRLLIECREETARARSGLHRAIVVARDEGESLSAIAATMGVTRQYVRQILKEAGR